jgi:predicted Zn-dependent protease
MNKGQRLIAWCLVGLLVSTGSQWLAWGGQPGYARSTSVLAQTPAENAAPSPTSLEALSLPESADAAEPESATADPLNQPDVAPQRPEEGQPVPEPTTDGEVWNDVEIESTGTDTSPPKVSKRQQILMTADEHYLAGDYETAEVLYRQVKDAVWQIDPATLRPAPITDPADLPPAGAVYWREAKAGYELGLAHRTLVPLELLAAEYPEFIPAQVFYAQYLVENDRAAEADAMLDQALMLYPSQPELLQARTQAQMALEQWIEAAITAKQFALLNPDHPDHDEMDALSEQNLDRFRAEMNEELTGNLIGNLITGTAGLLLTGGLIGPFTALNSAMILLQGESAVGASVAEQAQDQLPMLRDRQIEEYLNRIGQELASLAGRDEFTYEFYVVDEPELNAFALPGGKIFINAGAILKTQSEAELAGLVAHELAHAVLSHGFQMVTNGNLLSSIAGVIPIPEVGGLAANLIFSSYSREMERQADILGTQLLSAAGYAADGLHSLMITLEDEVGDRGNLQWFSSHPAPDERVDYLQQIVEVGGFNRYAYEGVAPHLTIQQRVARLATPEAESESMLDVPE